jgi:hypothetical protein
MSYGLNVEMHRQSELAKRYLAICHQIIPCLSQEVIPIYSDRKERNIFCCFI